MSELAEILERFEAPPALVLEARAHGDLEATWQACRSGEHRLWLAALDGATLSSLIEAAAAAVGLALERFEDPPAPLWDAVSRAVAEEPLAALQESAEACEALAEGGARHYRQSALGFESMANAAALIARAAEGLAIGEARREGARLERARHTGALVGAGSQIVLPRDHGPARHDLSHAPDPAQGAYLFSIAAAAEAIAAAETALAALGDASAASRIDAVVKAAVEDDDQDA